jgi:hypothetical protein
MVHGARSRERKARLSSALSSILRGGAGRGRYGWAQRLQVLTPGGGCNQGGSDEGGGSFRHGSPKNVRQLPKMKAVSEWMLLHV